MAGNSRSATTRKSRPELGANMHHFCVRRGLSCIFVLAVITLTVLAASAQTQKKESVWDKIKKAGQQGAQQGQQPQQPTQQPGQRQDGQGHPSAQSRSQINDSGPFKPPAGTKIEEKILAPLQEGASFEVSPHGVHVATTETDGSRRGLLRRRRGTEI